MNVLQLKTIKLNDPQLIRICLILHNITYNSLILCVLHFYATFSHIFFKKFTHTHCGLSAQAGLITDQTRYIRCQFEMPCIFNTESELFCYSSFKF